MPIWVIWGLKNALTSKKPFASPYVKERRLSRKKAVPVFMSLAGHRSSGTAHAGVRVVHMRIRLATAFAIATVCQAPV